MQPSAPKSLRSSRHARFAGARALVCAIGAITLAPIGGCSSSDAPMASPGRIDVASIDESNRVVLTGNAHPSATIDNDLGALEDGVLMEHMQLVLKRSAEQEAELDALIDQLHDKASPLYHQWLTSDEFAERFGVSRADVAAVSTWLTSHGFHVDNVSGHRMFIEFTGTVGQIREAFRTELHSLSVGGKTHFANMSDPQIPAALAPVVVGVHALHDFMPHPNLEKKGVVQRDPKSGAWTQVDPDFTIVDGTSTYYAVAPADFATIYNETPLFAAGIRGAGQTVVVIEDTLLKTPSDVTSFRTAFGLSGYAGTFSQITATGTSATCTASGVNGAEGEAALDAEWAGAAAPDAAIVLASCKDTTTVFGGLIALENLITSASPPPIVSISYGACESSNGASANASYVNAYKAAVAEGISVFVSAGDEGAASCDADKPVATHGISVSGFASTPYNVAVGGTDFADLYNSKQPSGAPVSTYWNTTDTATFGSAISYLPEIPWNDSCASQLIYTTAGFTQAYGPTGFCNSTTSTPKGTSFRTTSSGSGGPSAYSTQPSWQSRVVGLPTNSGGPRYLPDVSLFAANGAWGHFYVYCLSDTAQGGTTCNYASSNYTNVVNDLAAGGTSFASPALAGIQALVNQYTGSRQGNPNYVYYELAASEYGAAGSSACNSNGGTPSSPVLPASTCIFNDVTLGDMDVNCTGNTAASDCYGYSKVGTTTYQGVLSTATGTLNPAYGTNVGWDYATGLGTVNVYNLVHAW